MERRIERCGDCPALNDGLCVLHGERAAPTDKACGKAVYGLITRSEIEMAERRMQRMERCLGRS